MDSKNNSTNSKISGNSPASTQPASQHTIKHPAPKKPEELPHDPVTGYEKLVPQYRLAIDLKLLHYPYRIISKKLIAAQFKASEGTVQQWFAEGGACHKTYTAMAEIRRKELEQSIEEQQQMIQQGTANALVIINRSLEKAVENETITDQDYNNARDMLDRGGVPKQTKTDNNNVNRFDSEGMVAMATAIKSVLEQPKK